MNQQTGNTIKDRKTEIDTLREELSQVKEFMEQERTEVQSDLFDEFNIERVTVNHSSDNGGS